MGCLTDLAGWKSGRLTIVSRVENTARGAAQWLCRCECGRHHIARADNLLKGRVRQCALCSLERPANAAVRIEAWYHLTHHDTPAGGRVSGSAGFALVWRGERLLGEPVWVDAIQRKGSPPVVIRETVRHLARTEALHMPTDPHTATQWMGRHRRATTCHSYNEGQPVWAQWYARTNEWRGPGTSDPDEMGEVLAALANRRA